MREKEASKVDIEVGVGRGWRCEQTRVGKSRATELIFEKKKFRITRRRKHSPFDSYYRHLLSSSSSNDDENEGEEEEEGEEREFSSNSLSLSQKVKTEKTRPLLSLSLIFFTLSLSFHSPFLFTLPPPPPLPITAPSSAPRGQQTRRWPPPTPARTHP